MASEDRDESSRPSASAKLLMNSETLRSATESSSGPASKKSAKDEEKVSLFWRLFGGTILSITSLVLITLYNNLSTGISDLRADLNKQRDAMVDLVKKDDFTARSTKIFDRVNNLDGLKVDLEGLRERVSADAAAVDALKKETCANIDSHKKEITAAVDGIKKDAIANAEGLRKEIATAADGIKKDTGASIEGIKKELATTVDGLKKTLDATSDQQKRDEAVTVVMKERIAGVEALKKDLVQLDILKDKLMTLSVDVKSFHDDMVKLQQDSQKGQTADLERKAVQDLQYKQLDESLKDVQKALQNCREKLARLEGALPVNPPRSGSSSDSKP